MARTQSFPATRWSSEVEIEVTNLSLACMHNESRRGQQAIRTISIPSLRDGAYFFDVGRRAKAMILDQLAMLKSEAFAEGVKTGIWFDSLPVQGEIPVASYKLIVGSERRLGTMDEKYELVVPERLPYPFVYIVPSKQGTRMGYSYRIPGPVNMRFKVESVARRFTSDMLEEILTISPWHIGDHSAQGYGKGRLLGFKVVEQPQKFKTL